MIYSGVSCNIVGVYRYISMHVALQKQEHMEYIL